MNEKDRELLAQYHHTISEQLNSRLSESPKFFWVLIAVSGAYGFVLSNDPNNHKELFVLGIAVCVVILWANWYLAALGYAFRFLQNIQHCAEHALKWSPRYPPLALPEMTPPSGYFLAFITRMRPASSCFSCSTAERFAFTLRTSGMITSGYPQTAAMSVTIGGCLMYVPHRHYKYKFEDVRRAPEDCDIYSL